MFPIFIFMFPIFIFMFPVPQKPELWHNSCGLNFPLVPLNHSPQFSFLNMSLFSAFFLHFLRMSFEPLFFSSRTNCLHSLQLSSSSSVFILIARFMFFLLILIMLPFLLPLMLPFLLPLMLPFLLPLMLLFLLPLMLPFLLRKSRARSLRRRNSCSNCCFILAMLFNSFRICCSSVSFLSMLRRFLMFGRRSCVVFTCT